MNNQTAITLLKNLEQSLDDYCELNDEGKTAFSMAISALELFGNSEQLPSADRPQGKWKRRLVDNGFNADWVCSECGYRVKTDFVSFNYCPSCGARMKGADDD